MEENKGNFDLEYLLYGEKRPGCLGLLGQTIVSLLRYVCFPHRLTIGDARRLKEVNEKTGISFPLESEKINRK